MRKAVLLVLLIALAPLNSCKREEMKAPPEKKPYNAPAVTLTDLTGKQVTLASFKGKPVMINFWATWCVPCVAEVGEIEKLYEQRKDAGLVVLGINFKEPSEVVNKFVKKHDLTFPILLDEFGMSAQDFQVFGLPTTYFVNAEGVIQYSYMGEMTRDIINMGMKKIGIETI